MKMNYLLKSSNLEERKKYAQRRVLTNIIGLIVVMVILVTSPIRNFLFSIAKPMWNFENSFLNTNFPLYIKSKESLINERLAIEQKLISTGNLLVENNVLRNENETLKDLLGRKEIRDKTVLASVLVKPPRTAYDMLIVDIGADNNVNIGDKVIANANVYIGEVSEVFPHTAKIILYSTPGRNLPVTLGINSVSVEAVGMGGGNFNIYLPREVEVQEGDMIIVPSINPNVFGIVEKINFEDKDSFQTVLFKSPVNISELSFVEIII